MPIYNYVCAFCACEVEKIMKPAELNPKCPMCAGFMVKVPSIPGFRVDHTLYRRK